MKKTNIYLIICFLMIGAFINSCDIADGMIGVNDAILNNRSAPVISVIGGGSYAFTDADKTLELKIEAPQSGYTYYWSTTAGSIESEGVTVTYTAPEAEGDAVVTCYGARDEYVETKTAQKTIHNIEILTDNMLWLKADSITGLGNYAAVSSWSNSSTNAFSLTQSAPANMPRYVPDSMNGKPVIRFVDNTDMLSNTALTNIYSGFGVAQTKLTFFIVYKVQSYSSSYIMGVRSGSTNSFPVLLQVSTGQLRVYQNGTAASTYNAVPFPLTYGQSTILSSVCDTTASVAVPD
ncbi:MAG: hypothetical protein RBT69_06400, partial [Spirochaetia bacterium]|nr:hypothetical protein [Spirochaetia bacterium]